MAHITEIKPQRTLRHEIADKLREMAELVEKSEMEPIAYAAIVFTGAPWEEETGSIANWYAPYPKGVFLEGVKIGIEHQMLRQTVWSEE